MSTAQVQETPFFEIVTSKEAKDRGLVGPKGLDVPPLNVRYIESSAERAVSKLDFVPFVPPSTTKTLATYFVPPYASYWASYGSGLFSAHEGTSFRYIVRQHRIVERLMPLLVFARKDDERARPLDIHGSPAVVLIPPQVRPQWMPPSSSLAIYWFHNGMEILLACHPTVAPEDAIAEMSSLRELDPARSSSTGKVKLSARLRRLV